MQRRRGLPAGWYPDTIAGVEAFCRDTGTTSAGPRDAVAAIVPHAGWAFSGELAFATLGRLSPETETVVIVGGHLRPGDPTLVAPEESFEVPGGQVLADVQFRDLLTDEQTGSDERVDNTVEVQLPFIHFLLPNARIVWMRAAPDDSAARLGKRIARAAREVGRVTAVIGSTDLTHYGPAYRFEPAGGGAGGREWARENDASIVDAILASRTDKVLVLANDEKAACSAGGAVAAMEFAATQGANQSGLVGVRSSYDRSAGESFVGYAGISFSP